MTVLYRRTREEMTAYREEVEEAEREGIRIELLVAPKEILRDASGRLLSVRCERMALGAFDRSGRRKPISSGEPDAIFEVDQVISAIGQTMVPPATGNGFGFEMTRSGYLGVDERTGQTSVPWIFAGGDAATGPSTVVGAVAGGERAAVGIDKMLTGAEHAFWRENRVVETAFDPDAEPSAAPRTNPRTLLVERRKHCFREVELGWATPDAVREAKRCLRCDYRSEP